MAHAALTGFPQNFPYSSVPLTLARLKPIFWSETRTVFDITNMTTMVNMANMAAMANIHS